MKPLPYPSCLRQEDIYRPSLLSGTKYSLEMFYIQSIKEAKLSSLRT